MAVNPEIAKLLRIHQEVIIIYADQPDDTDESNLAVFAKFADKNGILAAYLADILDNLLKTNVKKPHSHRRRPPKTTIGT